MKAALIIPHAEHGGRIELRDVDQPQPKAGEVLVRIEATAINRGEVGPRKAHRSGEPRGSGVEFAGEVVGLIGPSGSGKSTLLKCLGAVIDPTRGRMTLGGAVIYDNGWKIANLRALRRDRIGFIFQAPYLIPFLNVTDNVALMPMLAGSPNRAARARAMELLQALDVAHRAGAETSALSGGEQQRVSIARALANRPPVILADEPTAPLD